MLHIKSKETLARHRTCLDNKLIQIHLDIAVKTLKRNVRIVNLFRQLYFSN